MFILVAGLLLGLSATADDRRHSATADDRRHSATADDRRHSATADDRRHSATAADHHHRVALSHRGRPVDATYRPIVTVAHRQIGAVAPGGRSATLRCAWTASIAVERHARRADGIAAARRVAAEPIEGSRPGWCGARVPVVAAAAIHARVAAVAARDGDALLADLDAAHRSRAG